VESLLIELGTKIKFEITSFNECLICEINLERLLQTATAVKAFTPISKFSPIIEDVNVVICESYEYLIEKIKTLSPLIKNVEFVDKYGDKLTLRITYHDDKKQLTKGDVASVRKILIDSDFQKS